MSNTSEKRTLPKNYSGEKVHFKFQILVHKYYAILENFENQKKKLKIKKKSTLTGLRNTTEYTFNNHCIDTDTESVFCT